MNEMKIDFCVKNNFQSGGLSSYDISLFIIDNQNNHIGCNFTSSGASYFNYIVICNDTFKSYENNYKFLTTEFKDFKNISFKISNSEIEFFLENKLLYNNKITKIFDNLQAIEISFKGSGCVKFVKIFDNNDNLKYDYNFANNQ